MDNERLLTAEELAAELRISPRTVRNWAWARKIPAVRVSRKVVRFRLSEVLAAMEKESGGK